MTEKSGEKDVYEYLTIRELSRVRPDKVIDPKYQVPVDHLLGRKPKSYLVKIPGFEAVSIPAGALPPDDCQRVAEYYGEEYRFWGLRQALDETKFEYGRVFLISEREMALMREYLTLGWFVQEPLHHLASISVITAGYPWSGDLNRLVIGDLIDIRDQGEETIDDRKVDSLYKGENPYHIESKAMDAIRSWRNKSGSNSESLGGDEAVFELMKEAARAACPEAIVNLRSVIGQRYSILVKRLELLAWVKKATQMAEEAKRKRDFALRLPEAIREPFLIEAANLQFEAEYIFTGASRQDKGNMNQYAFTGMFFGIGPEELLKLDRLVNENPKLGPINQPQALQEELDTKPQEGILDGNY